MVNTISTVLVCLGLIGLVYAYIKRNRTILLISGLALVFGAGWTISLKA